MDMRKLTLAAAGLLGAGFVAGCTPEPRHVVYAAPPPPPAVVVAPRRTVVVTHGPRCHWVTVRDHRHHDWRRVRRCR